ncbi:alpha/beta hydrolase [Microbacterium sp. gxy059]|uniref:alpha/beta hydrolase n=1 Tax=Microbacterium sp. gxy059 TaxID=2957199 RepID=UPI003D9722F4
MVRVGPISYGEDSRQHLDLFRPAGSEKCGPVLVCLHGGGYSSGGNRREARALLHRLTARGWTCISAAYRLRPRFGFEDHLADARAVLAWAHAYAGAHGGAGAPVAMAGSSAGGHLAALCALTQDDGAPDRPRADAVVSLYAWYDRYYGRGPDETPASTPFALDASKAPPFFIVHGGHDSFVPVEQARALRDHLRAGSRRDVWYAELPGAQHGFDTFASWRLQAVMDGVDGFLRHTVKRAPDRPMRPDDPTKG